MSPEACAQLLALDLATTTGWALRDRGALSSGYESFEVKTDEPRGIRFKLFRDWLRWIVLDGDRGAGRIPVRRVVYELRFIGAGPAGQKAGFILTGLAAIVEELCARERIIVLPPVPAAQLKKWTTGHGDADKAMMLDAVARRWGRRVDSADEADALALLRYVEEHA